MEPVTVKLQEPVVMGDVVVDAVTFKRKLTVRDMQEVRLGPAPTFGEMAKVIARLGGVSSEAIMRMGMEDFDRVMEAATPFLPASRVTGEQ